MKRYHKKWLEKGLMIKISVLFLFGFLAGILFFFGLTKWKPDLDPEEKEQYLKSISAQGITGDLFFYVTWQKIKELLLFFCFSLTWLWLPAIYYVVLRKAILFGYLCNVSFSLFQKKGLFLLFGYYFPQVLLRIPMWMLCFQAAWELWQKSGLQTGTPDSAKSLHKKILLQINVKRIIVILGLCIAEGGLETTAGTFLLKKILLYLTGK